ncbi:MAG: alpha/beta hydrolase [Pseudomonadales bacterium]
MQNDRCGSLLTASLLGLAITFGGLLVPEASAADGNAVAQAKAASPAPGVRASVPGRQIVLNGMRYHVGDQGSGDKVVLLLHGMPDTSSTWNNQIPALVQAGYRVLVPDMLGYGETEKPTDPRRYSLENMVYDMIALLDAMGVQQVEMVVGHDWGAGVSWELVLNFPDRFRRHVTMSVGHPDMMLLSDSPADVKESWYMYLNAQPDSAQLYAANDGAFLKDIILPTHPELDEVWARMKEPEAMNGMLNWDRGNTMAAMYLAVATSTAPPRKCTVPTLGMWSTGDTYLWESQMEASPALMGAAWRYLKVENASHWLMLDQPERVNAALLEWLERS